ncbi:hypothetical protein LWI28_003596 [Acer negundo]|uniref:Histidine-containing phosphotransfer protein n=1 Tax=Acer negundo TaxID=4023 RepID=A0AAD5NYF3_ACENE|nr:hypothetical protein LWI28_003596 [Acer negundo]
MELSGFPRRSTKRNSSSPSAEKVNVAYRKGKSPMNPKSVSFISSKKMGEDSIQKLSVKGKACKRKELLNDNYKEIEQLEDDDNPGFLEEVFDSFWSNSTQLLASIEEDMYKTPPDYISMDKNLHQLKGSSASCFEAAGAGPGSADP